MIVKTDIRKDRSLYTLPPMIQFNEKRKLIDVDEDNHLQFKVLL
jgi:hypothetical protein